MSQQKYHDFRDASGEVTVNSMVQNQRQDQVLVSKQDLERLLNLCHRMEDAFNEVSTLFATISEVSEHHQIQMLGNIGVRNSDYWAMKWIDAPTCLNVLLPVQEDVA